MNRTSLSRPASLLFLTWTAIIAVLFVRECANFAFGVLPHCPPFIFPSLAALKLLGVHLFWTFAAVLFVLGTMPTGIKVMQILRVSGTASEIGRWCAVALGLALWGLMAFGLAAVGLAQPWIYRLLSIIPVLFGMGIVFRYVSLFTSRLRTSLEARRWPYTLGIALFFGLAWAASVLPETFTDSLHYVVALPAEALRSGRWAGIDGLCSSGFPALAQSLYLWGLSWGDDRLCKLLNLAVGASWVRLVYAWSQKRRGESAGLWSALFLIGTPIVSLYLWSATADILSGFLLTAAFIKWNERAEDPQNHHHETLALLLLGCAGAVKYTVFLALPFFALTYLWRIFRRGINFRTILLNLSAFVLPLLPYWAMNTVRFGDPFFPYADAWLGHSSTDTIAGMASLLADQRGTPNVFEHFKTFFLWQVTGVHMGRLGFIGPMILILLPPAVLFYWRRKEVGGEFLFFFLTTLVAFLCLTDRVRFIIPFLGIYACGFGMALQWVEETMSWGGTSLRRLMGIVVFVEFFVLSLVFIVFDQGYPVLAGRQSPEEYLSIPHPFIYSQPSYGAYRYLKTAAKGPLEKIYLLGETRSFRCPIQAYVNTIYDSPLYYEWFTRGITGRPFIEKLRAEGFTYWLVNPQAMARDVAPEYQDPESLKKLAEIFQLLPPPVYQDQYVILYKVS